MQCPECQFNNPEGMKFCGECGCEIKFTCPHCNFKNPPNFKFCGECGSSLVALAKDKPKELTFDEKLDKIQRYLPKGVTEKILAQRGRIEGERKHITVLFCDLVGFTPMVEKLGHEATYNLMDKIYEILIHKVHEYEGTVNEFTGDGIMALFGAPIALEDAPQRAILSSLSIHREMAKFKDKMKQEIKGLPSIKMRIGIHTGPVVVGTLGNDLRVEFKAVGDTVNLASRMENLAEPGATFVTEDTFKLSEGLFRFEALGEMVVKGKKEAVKVHRVIAPSTRRTRFDVSAEKGLTPFVGRDRELEILLDAFERAKLGQGQAISLMSEAGIGKSRLLYEFRKAVANEDVTFLEGRCLSYSKGVAYHPLIDILKSNFDIQDGESDAAITEKVQKGLKRLYIDKATNLPYFLELLSVKDSGIDKIVMSQEGKRDRIIEALKRIVLKGSEIRPLIMAFEDLHWVDKSSEEVLKYLSESIPGAAVFLIFTYRPEFVHQWGAKSYHNQLTLNRLSNRESLGVASHLLGTEEFDQNIEELILEKGEGVPFFIEEFIKSLKDLGFIERDSNRYCIAKGIERVTIPSTIHDVIMARVDALSESAKELLQTGSVIGREFSYELIKRVSDLPEKEMLSEISALKDSELLYERGIFPGTTYIFKHALTQEVVYDSILTTRKKKLHEDIANAIEEEFKDNPGEYFCILAEHYVKSENFVKGAEYSKQAARKAYKTAVMSDGIAYTQKRIACLEKLDETDQVQRTIVDARTNLGLYFQQLNYFVNSKEAVEPIIELATKLGCEKRLSQIYAILGTYYWLIEEKISEAFHYLDQGFKIAKEIKDVMSLIVTSYWFGTALSWNCQFAKAEPYIQRALDLTLEYDVLWNLATNKASMGYFIHHHQGKLSLGYQITDEAIRIAEKSGDTWSLGISYMCHGASCYGMGLMEEATKNLTKAFKYCEKINFHHWASFSHHFLGKAYFVMGQYQKSQEHFNNAANLSKRISIAPAFTNLFKIGEARARVMRNDKDIDLKTLYTYAAESQISVFSGRMCKYIAEILLNMNDQQLFEAEDWIKKAIATDKKKGMMFYLGRDYAFHAELLIRRGNKSKAKETLAMAMAVFKDSGADAWVERYEKRLKTIT
jgi:class 3 adenylate cyclase/tetratricopeptide (TPR) repeat protein